LATGFLNYQQGSLKKEKQCLGIRVQAIPF